MGDADAEREFRRIRFEFGEQSQSRRKRRGPAKDTKQGRAQRKRELRTAKEDGSGIVHPAVISSGICKIPSTALDIADGCCYSVAKS